MYQPEDNFNSDRQQDDNSAKNLSNIDANISASNVAARQQQIARVFIKLIAIGLVFGAVLGSGLYYLLHKFGLTTKPYQLQQERIEPEKQQPVQPLPEIKLHSPGREKTG